MNHRSLVFRLGAWYTLLLGVTFILVGIGTFYGLQHYLRANLRDSLRRHSTEVQQILIQAPADVTSAEVAQEIENRAAPEFNNRFNPCDTRSGRRHLSIGTPSDRSFDPAAVPPVPDMTGAADVDRAAATVVDDQNLMLRTTPVSSVSGTYLVELGVSAEADRRRAGTDCWTCSRSCFRYSSSALRPAATSWSARAPACRSDIANRGADELVQPDAAPAGAAQRRRTGAPCPIR